MKINQVIIENNLTEDPKNWRPADPNNFDSDNDFYNARDQEDGKEEDWYDDPEVDPDAWMDESVTQGTLRESDSPVASAITRRILLQRSDLLQKYGPEKVTAAIDDVADFVGDTEEIGSSDVSGWIKQVEQSLAGMGESLKEDLQADDGEYYSNSDKFFGQFEADHFDNEETSPDGMEIRGYIDGVCVMAWRFKSAKKVGGWGIYDDSALQGMAEQGNANSGRRGPDYQDNSPVIPGRVEPLPQGLRHHADASRYGGTEPDDEDDRLLSPQQRHRLHRAVTPGDLDEQEKIAGRHDPDDFDDMIGRLKQLAGAGPLKTVYDPEKRVYKNVPHAVQPAQQPKKAQR